MAEVLRAGVNLTACSDARSVYAHRMFALSLLSGDAKGSSLVHFMKCIQIQGLYQLQSFLLGGIRVAHKGDVAFLQGGRAECLAMSKQEFRPGSYLQVEV
jgi:hypothetical protein